MHHIKLLTFITLLLSTFTYANQTVPANAKTLIEYLKKGEYKKFQHKESKPHPSIGPHGLVQVYANDIAANAIAQKKEVLPKNAAIIKELLNNDKSIKGYAVMVKTDDKAGKGKGWYWYEIFTNSNNVVANGQDVPLCAGCHSTQKTDMILTKFPLK